MWPARLSRRQAQGQQWERAALTYLRRQKLTPVEENFRCKGGEIDLIMREGATLVFVEVRQRANREHGGAAASITPAKMRRLVYAAQVYLLRFPITPPCRFDLVAIDGEHIDWLRNIIEV
jgi:putative endonuclease